MEPEQQQNFCRNVQYIVEKDVVRTDRGNPYFAGEDNPNIHVMKWEILRLRFEHFLWIVNYYGDLISYVKYEQKIKCKSGNM